MTDSARMLTPREVEARIATRLLRHLIAGGILFVGAWVTVNPGDLLSLSSLALITGAGLLGGWSASVIHYLRYATSGRLDERFIVTYTWRPVLGAVVSVLVTILVAGGFLTWADQQTGETTVMVLAGIAALAGLFSKRATAKMNEIAGVVFARGDNDKDEKERGHRRTPVGAPPTQAATGEDTGGVAAAHSAP